MAGWLLDGWLGLLLLLLLFFICSQYILGCYHYCGCCYCFCCEHKKTGIFKHIVNEACWIKWLFLLSCICRPIEPKKRKKPPGEEEGEEEEE